MRLNDSKHAFARQIGRHEGVWDESIKGYRADPYKAVNERRCREIWRVVQLHYPGHPWHVAVNTGQGIAQIGLPTFTSWTFNIRLSDLAGDPGMKVVVKGAGELLERYRLPRAGFDVSHYVAAQAKFRPHLTMNRRPPD